jgi:ribonucleoside-diphosphate reductase alpha chain
MAPLKKVKQILQVRKRNGSLVDFDINKIANAVLKAFLNTGEGGEKEAKKIAKKVVAELLDKVQIDEAYIPKVEEIQDLVEKHLIWEGLVLTAKHYILYRKEHSDLRARGAVSIPDELKKEFLESRKYFKSSLSEFVFYTSYARWIDDKSRRETWVETVDRFVAFMKENLGDKLKKREYSEIREAVLNQEIIPSMRLLWSSGPAARRSNVTAYNCAFVSPSCYQDFGEIMYISMCGTGIGYSVEKNVVERLPVVAMQQNGRKKILHVVGDSKEGWADALVLGMKTWYEGGDIEFDYSKVRGAGARLQTMGGRASGPAPLKDLMKFTKERILRNQGKKLSTLEIHDIICKIGEVVIAGGVRRSAMISLSDLSDLEMRHAKDGQFYVNEPQRSMANNSAVYNSKPSSVEFLEEWLTIAKSGSGERGLFNREGLEWQLPERRWEKFKDHYSDCGINPCGEIVLRSKQFCNLSAIIIRAGDTEKDLLRKIRLATIIGTYQASLTNFQYLSPEWKKNCEEEALLGVSFTGYFDNKLVRNGNILRKMRDSSVKVNKVYAKRFGINPATCVTCVKPSGNSSQLLDTASGLHPRFAEYYIRRVRVSATDPVFKMLKAQGVPYNPEVGQSEQEATTFVLEFPVKAPDGAITRHDLSAIEFLEHWKMIKMNFTEHNPSATVYVGNDEWVAVGEWIYKNWDIVGGLTFLPRNENTYQLAPYEEIDKKRYEELCEKVANVDFSKLVAYEQMDNTQGAKEVACAGGACEI